MIETMPYVTIIEFDEEGEGFTLIEIGLAEDDYRACFPCCNCRFPFVFSPLTVPSIRLSLVTGEPNPAEGEASEKFPVCNLCIEQGNEKRKAVGKEPFAYTDPRSSR